MMFFLEVSYSFFNIIVPLFAVSRVTATGKFLACPFLVKKVRGALSNFGRSLLSYRHWVMRLSMK
jgi:hypothetical protein